MYSNYPWLNVKVLHNLFPVENVTTQFDSSISDVPGPPGVPQFDHINATSVTISYTAPVDDGGAPITNYVIEKQERFSTRWSRVNVEPVTGLSYHITDLMQGEEYTFRVSAQNKAGVGKPSDASKPVIPKPPYGKFVRYIS